MKPRTDWRVRIAREDINAPKDDASTFCDLWEETKDPVWLSYLAAAGGVTLGQFVFANCAVARLCLHLIPKGEDRPRIAIETAEAWTRDEATPKQMRLAQEAACDYANFVESNPIIAAVNAIQCLSYTYSCSERITPYWVLMAGIKSHVICGTMREHFPFERPKLTVWKRLALVCTETEGVDGSGNVSLGRRTSDTIL